MESRQAKVSSKLDQIYAAGFDEGYTYVVDVLKGCLHTQSHLNPMTRRILNEALAVIVSELETNKPQVSDAPLKPSDPA